MICLGLWMIWTILRHKLKPLDAMNYSGLWRIWLTLGFDDKALDFMNSLGLSLTWTTLGRELNVLDAMKNSRLCDIPTLGSLACKGINKIYT